MLFNVRIEVYTIINNPIKEKNAKEKKYFNQDSSLLFLHFSKSYQQKFFLNLLIEYPF